MMHLPPSRTCTPTPATKVHHIGSKGAVQRLKWIVRRDHGTRNLRIGRCMPQRVRSDVPEQSFQKQAPRGKAPGTRSHTIDASPRPFASDGRFQAIGRGPPLPTLAWGQRRGVGTSSSASVARPQKCDGGRAIFRGRRQTCQYIGNDAIRGSSEARRERRP